MSKGRGWLQPGQSFISGAWHGVGSPSTKEHRIMREGKLRGRVGGPQGTQKLAPAPGSHLNPPHPVPHPHALTQESANSPSRAKCLFFFFYYVYFLVALCLSCSLWDLVP